MKGTRSNALDYIAHAMSTHNYTLDAACYLWRWDALGVEAASVYFWQFCVSDDRLTITAAVHQRRSA